MRNEQELILLVGVGFFLKYAYDNQWIGPAGRTAIIYLAGGAALGAGTWGRKRGYTLVSDGVSALGFGVLYAATYFGSAVYELNFLPRNAAFAIMCITTAVGVATALLHRSQVLGFLTLLGGYLTPVLLSSGADRGEVLIAYLTLLSIGSAGVAYRERWRAVNVLAILGTYLLFFGWFDRHYDSTRLATALTGVSIFAALFIASSVLPAFGRRRPGWPEDAAYLLGNSVAAFWFFYKVLAEEHRVALVVVTLGLGAVHAILFRAIATRVASSSPIALVNLVLGMAAVTIAIPLKLELWGIPLAWAIEGVAFTYLGVRLRNPWLQFGGIAAHFIAAGYLLGHLGERRDEPFPFWNPSFGTWAFFVASLLASSWLNWRQAKAGNFFRRSAAAYVVAGMTFLWVLLSKECYQYFYNLKEAEGVGRYWASTSLSVLWAVYAAFLLAMGLRRDLRWLRYGAFLLFAVTLFKVFFADMAQLQAVYRILAFTTLGALLVAASYAYTRFARSRTLSEPPKA